MMKTLTLGFMVATAFAISTANANNGGKKENRFSPKTIEDVIQQIEILAQEEDDDFEEFDDDVETALKTKPETTLPIDKTVAVEMV
ncbi:hypothetical protein CBF23_002820 [Marinomonas agarivorans]|nr:hypothetical protein CBF23_002820 [Marinomonas agarivorans]